MALRVSAAQAKARLSELVASFLHQGKRYIIERRAKPVAALVTVGELKELEQRQAISERPLGALALVGAWRELEDKDLDDAVVEIYAERDRDVGRLVTIEL